MQTSESSWNKCCPRTKAYSCWFFPLPALAGGHVGHVWIPPWTLPHFGTTVCSLEICLPARRDLGWWLCVQVPVRPYYTHFATLLTLTNCFLPQMEVPGEMSWQLFPTGIIRELSDLSRKEGNRFLVGRQC